MNKKTFIAGFILCVSSVAYTQSSTGKIFPDIAGETCKGKALSIPSDTKGKITLIGMAYSKKAEDDLKTWLSPVYNKFIAKTGMFDSEYDVNLYFIPLFTGANYGAVNAAKKKLKEDTDEILHPHVLFYAGGIKKYKEELGFEEKDSAYFFVLDKNGKIIYTTTGQFSEEKMDAIEDTLIQ